MGTTTIQDTIKAIDNTYQNFKDAQVLEVLVGPRREVTLVVMPFVWRGSRGELEAPISVRFGGIEDFRRVAERFREILSLQSEIGFLGVDHAWQCKGGDGHAFRYEAERRDVEFSFCCTNATIEHVSTRQ